jgi:hypothetical protein
MKPQLKLDHYTEFTAQSIPAEMFQQQPTSAEFDKEGPDIIRDAKHLLWMVTQQEEVTNLEQHQQSERERDAAGKKLADKIRDLSKNISIYETYPEEAAMLLAIWAEYRSKKETSNYLAKSFKDNPSKAVHFLKCYLPAAHQGKETAAIKDLDIQKYNLIAQVIDAEKLYETLSQFFKFKAQKFDDIVPITPLHRDLANKFMRLHVKARDSSE